VPSDSPVLVMVSSPSPWRRASPKSLITSRGGSSGAAPPRAPAPGSRLEVAVDDADVVRRRQPGGHLRDERQRLRVVSRPRSRM
jgi:hypothetical protein